RQRGVLTGVGRLGVHRDGVDVGLLLGGVALVALVLVVCVVLVLVVAGLVRRLAQDVVIVAAGARRREQHQDQNGPTEDLAHGGGPYWPVVEPPIQWCRKRRRARCGCAVRPQRISMYSDLAAPARGVATRAPGMPAAAPPTRAASIVAGGDR